MKEHTYIATFQMPIKGQTGSNARLKVGEKLRKVLFGWENIMPPKVHSLEIKDEEWKKLTVTSKQVQVTMTMELTSYNNKAAAELAARSVLYLWQRNGDFSNVLADVPSFIDIKPVNIIFKQPSPNKSKNQYIHLIKSDMLAVAER